MVPEVNQPENKTMTKAQLLSKFKKEKNVISDFYCAVTAEEFHARDLEVISLCEKYLLDFPQLDCVDVGQIVTPKRVLKRLTDSMAVKGVNYVT